MNFHKSASSMSQGSQIHKPPLNLWKYKIIHKVPLLEVFFRFFFPFCSQGWCWSHSKSNNLIVILSECHLLFSLPITYTYFHFVRSFYQLQHCTNFFQIQESISKKVVTKNDLRLLLSERPISSLWIVLYLCCSSATTRRNTLLKY